MRHIAPSIAWLCITVGFVGFATSGCAETAALLPAGMYTAPDLIAPDMVPIAANGTYNEADAQAVLKKDFKNAVMLTPTSSSTQAKPHLMPAKLASLTFETSQDHNTTITGRQYFAMSSDFGVDYVISFSEKTEFQYMLEFELLNANPQYFLKYKIRPDELLEWQLAALQNGDRAVVLFSKHIFAPELMMVHELLKTEAKANFHVYLKADGGLFTERKYSHGRQFVIRAYDKPEFVNDLCGTTGGVMFEEVASSDTTADSNGDSVQPELLRFSCKGKRYKCSRAYALHLAAEQVSFDCTKAGPHIAGVDAPAKQLEQRTDRYIKTSNWFPAGDNRGK